MVEITPCGDAELALGVARGDQACLAVFFQTYHPSVYRYLLCLTGNREDAEDLAQDAILSAASSVRSFRRRSSLKTWVHRVAFHKYTHWRRRQGRQTALSAEIEGGEPFSQVDAAHATLAALERIGPALAHPFVLSEVNGLTLQEIADALDLPLGTVKSRLYTARQRLQQLLAPQESHHV